MQRPVEITFKDVEHSDAVEHRIMERVAELERIYDRITSMRVVVTKELSGRQRSPLFHIKIFMLVPGGEIAINRGTGNHQHEDMNLAIRDAFNAATRQLQDHVRKIRGDVKIHEAQPQGRVIRIFPEHGFIATADGQEVYFHKNSVPNGGFQKLEVGSEVRLVIAEGESALGSQASTVHPVGKTSAPA